MCDDIRRMAAKGYTAKSIISELSCDPHFRTIYYHARGECSHQGEEPPIRRKGPGWAQTDSSIPSIETTKNYNG